MILDRKRTRYDDPKYGNLEVASELYRFITDEAIPGTGVDAREFWTAIDTLIHELAPVNRQLIAKRDLLQEKIDSYHKARIGKPHNASEYKAFLEEIGYLLPEPSNVSVNTENVDPEVATTAGPQLVVPVMNARYALNAANARWGAYTTHFMGRMSFPTMEVRHQGLNIIPSVVKKSSHSQKRSLIKRFVLKVEPTLMQRLTKL